MPHYKDGTPAEIGDNVKGIPYNTKGKEVVGTLIQITEDSQSCNCIVAFVEPFAVDAPAATVYPIIGFIGANIVRRKGGRIKQGPDAEQSQEVVLLNPKYDYGTVSDFVKI